MDSKLKDPPQEKQSIDRLTGLYVIYRPFEYPIITSMRFELYKNILYILLTLLKLKIFNRATPNHLIILLDFSFINNFI
jgi:hypothetical protein